MRPGLIGPQHGPQHVEKPSKSIGFFKFQAMRPGFIGPQHGPQLPSKLSDARNLAKFIRHVLPQLLGQMQSRYRWPDIPRTVVHDKASYMVTNMHERLHATFAGALKEAGFSSWIGPLSGTTSWLVKKFGDVYLHETVIAHIGRLLDTDFSHQSLHETPRQFAQRMQQVEDFMNSPAFAAEGGKGLMALAKELRPHCQQLIDLRGERIPK